MPIRSAIAKGVQSSASPAPKITFGPSPGSNGQVSPHSAASCEAGSTSITGNLLRAQNAATARTCRSYAGPTTVIAVDVRSRVARLRAAKTGTMMSDISGSAAISRSIASRGTCSTRAVLAQRIVQSIRLPTRNAIPPIDWRAPGVLSFSA